MNICEYYVMESICWAIIPISSIQGSVDSKYSELTQGSRVRVRIFGSIQEYSNICFSIIIMKINKIQVCLIHVPM